MEEIDVPVFPEHEEIAIFDLDDTYTEGVKGDDQG